MNTKWNLLVIFALLFMLVGGNVTTAQAEDLPVLEQLPNGVNLAIADSGAWTASACYWWNPCRWAEDVVVQEGTTLTISGIQLWGAYSGDPTAYTDDFTVIIYQDEDGLPGTVIYTENHVNSSRAATGIILLEYAEEFLFTLTLSTSQTLEAGVHWIEILNNSGTLTAEGDLDNIFGWEMGHADTLGLSTQGVAGWWDNGWRFYEQFNLSLRLLGSVTTTPTTYSVSGTIYEDINANGTRDADELGEPARVILAISVDQGPFYFWTTTDAAEDGSYEFTFPVTHPEGLSFSVYVEQADGIKITQTPAPFAYPSEDLTGLDIGLHIVVLTPTPARFPDGVQGAAYSQTITVTGGDAPYTFTPSPSRPLPAGLSYTFDTQLGTMTLSGTPTETGAFLAHVDFTDANGAFGQVSEYFTIHPPLGYSPAFLPNGSLGAPYNQTILLSGGIAPYTFRIGGEEWLPAGLTLDTSSGNIVLSGTPTEAGRVTLDVYVTDQIGTEIEIQMAFWVKTDPSLTITSSLNPSLQSQEVTFSLGSTATVSRWPAPWGQVTFYADGTAIAGCEGLWMGSDPTTEQPAPNPITCKTSSLVVGSHTITTSLTTVYGPYNNAVATLQGGQTVNADVPQYQSAGFGAPLDLGNVLNIAKAGQMIPLKWRLLDASGNPVLNLDPASVTLTVSAYACQAGVPTDAIETYVTGTTALQNLGNGYYQLNWKTDKTWTNSCKQITLKIGDWSGDGFTALFQFKK